MKAAAAVILVTHTFPHDKEFLRAVLASGHIGGTTAVHGAAPSRTGDLSRIPLTM
ncbi:MAG TPA: hypothetical protein VGD78_15090 [Chthoniobacterales bacterium]